MFQDYIDWERIDKIYYDTLQALLSAITLLDANESFYIQERAYDCVVNSSIEETVRYAINTYKFIPNDLQCKLKVTAELLQEGLDTFGHILSLFETMLANKLCATTTVISYIMADNAVYTADNVIDMADNVIDMVDNVIDTADNVADNVIDMADDILYFTPYDVVDIIFSAIDATSEDVPGNTNNANRLMSALEMIISDALDAPVL
jgi:hypothetical protein